MFAYVHHIFVYVIYYYKILLLCYPPCLEAAGGTAPGEKRGNPFQNRYREMRRFSVGPARPVNDLI